MKADEGELFNNKRIVPDNIEEDGHNGEDGDIEE